MGQYGITKEQSNLWQKALWEATEPNALDDDEDSLKTLFDGSKSALTGLLGYMGINVPKGFNLNLGRQQVEYRPNDRYKFSLGEKGGYPELGMRIKL